MSENTDTPKDSPLSPEERDWWEDFRVAVEDPQTDIYEYLKASVLSGLGFQEDASASDWLNTARKKAFKELLEFTDPKELREKLEALEKKTFLFNLKARTAIKLTRVIVDTYLNAQGELRSEKLKNKNPCEKKTAVKEIIDKKLHEEKADEEIQKIADSIEDQNAEDVRHTIQDAVEQLSNEKNASLISKDILSLSQKYLTLDNAANIAIHALPLITWQYRWALAAGLGAYTARMSVVHSFLAAKAKIGGDGDLARAEGKKAVTALKAAGGNILIIGLSPAVGKVPKMLAGFLNFGIKSTYDSTLESLKEMLEQEGKEAGSTPIGTKITKSVKRFFGKNQDTLVTLSTNALKHATPSAATDAIATVSQRVSLTSLKRLSRKVSELYKAICKRYTSVDDVAGEERKLAESIQDIKHEIEVVGHKLKTDQEDDACEEEAALNAEPQEPLLLIAHSGAKPPSKLVSQNEVFTRQAIGPDGGAKHKSGFDADADPEEPEYNES